LGDHAARRFLGDDWGAEGTFSSVLQKKRGKIARDAFGFSGVGLSVDCGPEHAWMRDTGRAEYVAATEAEAMNAVSILAEQRRDHSGYWTQRMRLAESGEAGATRKRSRSSSEVSGGGSRELDLRRI